ncbi:hypothetical protein [uncultured Hoeflea sp.]|uniref:hypothetical protein n=1 Tax=uncultured Hoeflea sp. TaxID=538666 RepID=UPI002612BBCF|nr:hypothetical protein [uncultured Hoeflea sp.]
MTIHTKPFSIFAVGLVFGFYLLAASVRGLDGAVATNLSDDALVLSSLKGTAIFALVFFIGHFALQRTGFSQTTAYVGLGAASAILVDVLHTPTLLWQQMIADGNLSTRLLVPALLGVVLGAVYRWTARTHEIDEDLDGLSDEYRRQLGDSEYTEDGDAGLIVHGDAAYFDGPLRVRTSLSSFLLAAAAGCGANLVIATIFKLSTYSNFKIGDKETYLNHDLLLQMFSGVLSGLLYSFLAFLPVIFLVALAHMVLRFMRQTGYAAYGIAGLLSSPVTIILTGGMAASVGMLAIIPAMIAALAYRRFAGLEPAPVAEDIIARNERDLVGKNHVRRKVGRVVMPSNAAIKSARSSRGIS